MFCVKCGHDNTADAAFCNKCGVPMPGAAAAGVPAAAPLRPTRATPATEVEIWSGSVHWKGMLNVWWLLSFLLLVPILIFALVVWIRRSSISYRITTERITITRGMLSRESEDIQLMRVEDVQYRQTFLQRMFNVGTLHLLSTDKQEPDLFIHGIIDPVHFKEKLWSLVRERRAGVVMMEPLNV